ncbi:ABC transporter ATP-binding protein [Anaerococcus sp. Marseille-Q7828]|uniref:ATP-binding cassette domain-containing protein n=1 Tax=Anaerococcus sp. Marseille-Q7828 TaxID=3036300 RepID=UPI0024AD307A|nr:ABC transporter ATP-binding protein [Anaerococcus sp. Marseille-Q7828]
MGQMIEGKTSSFVDDITIKFNDSLTYEANFGSIKILLDSILRIVSYSYVAMRTLSASYGPQISFGDFSAIIRANENFMTSFQKMFSESIGFSITLRNLEPLYEFMNLEVESEEDLYQASDFESLEFKNVSFAYPGSDRLILDDISFKINKGDKISIVGVNNAGKTTIVKLILRFFEVDKGEILYNGRNINDYQKESLYKKISAVLQDFAIMPFSIKENIIGTKDYDEGKIDQILNELELKERIDGLDKGFDTYLNKDIFEDATDFSLGQKQKLAIGRCLYQNPDLIILDEPTASLDPLAEAKIYENFNQMTEGKTAIFISHRMSSSRFTDKILLLDEGKVKAYDSHNNLMKYDNIYSRLYKSQAKYYTN